MWQCTTVSTCPLCFTYRIYRITCLTWPLIATFFLFRPRPRFHRITYSILLGSPVFSYAINKIYYDTFPSHRYRNCHTSASYFFATFNVAVLLVIHNSKADVCFPDLRFLRPVASNSFSSIFSYQFVAVLNYPPKMAYLLYKHLREKGSRPREPCEHERRLRQNSDSPLELSYLARCRRGDESCIDGASSQQLAQKSYSQSIHEQANFDPAIPCSICKEEKQATNRYRWKLITGLCLPFSVQALDATIIAGALPFIASDFSEYPATNSAFFEHTDIQW